MREQNDYRLFFCLLIFLFVFSEFFQAQEREVIVEGKSSLTNIDIEKARDRALEDALRNAVEQGVGVYVSSESMTQNYRLIYDRILTNAHGYVREYRILNEEKQADFFVVKIAAVVKLGNIENDLQSINLLMERKALPRLMILIQEGWLTNQDNRNFSSKQSQAEVNIVSAFLSKGFFVLDSTAVKDSRSREQAIKALRGDQKAASLLGQLMEADIVAIGEVISQNKGTIAPPMITVSSTVNLRVIKVDTGEILAARSWNAPGAGVAEISAAHESIKNVTERVCNDLISDVLNKWVGETSGTHIIQIHVYEIMSFSDLNFLEKSLLDWIPGIQNLYRRSYERGMAILDARIEGEADNIASVIQRKTFGRFKVIVTGFSQNLIKLTIVYPGGKS